MTAFELLVFIFVIIETLQVFFLLRNNRKLKTLVEQIITDEEYAAAVATNMLFGFMEEVHENKEKQEMFFGFLNTCAISAYASIMQRLDQLPVATKEAALKGLPKGLKSVIKTADAIGIDIKGLVKGKAQEAVEEVTTGW
jgi:hypothetical protein